MRFSQKLSAHLTPEWREQYIAYEDLKAILVDAVDNAPPFEGDAMRASMQHHAKYEEQFFERCDQELRKINNFYAEKLAEATRKHEALQAELRSCLHMTSSKSSKRISRINLGLMLSKRKAELLRFAFSEFYLSLVLLQNYQSLNHTGFRKILKKHDKLLNTQTGQQWFENHVDKAHFYTNRDIMNLIRETENIFTIHLEGGDRSRAMKRLRVPPLEEVQHPWTTFRVGLYMGAFLVILTSAIIKFSKSDFNEPNYITLLQLFRGPLLIIVFLFLLSINVYGWRKAGVNHILIFEIDPRDHLTASHIMEVAMMLAFIWGLALLGVLFWRELDVPPYVWPLTFILILLAYLLNPLRIFFYSSRGWSLKLIGRVMAAPLFHVGFADFWLGDQLNSLVTCFFDFKCIVCFYATNGDWFEAKENRPRFVDDYIITPFVRCLPAWFRFAQTLRRYWDTRLVFPFLVNAGKYASSFPVVICGTMMKMEQHKYATTFENPYVWCYLIFHIVNSFYCVAWDLLKDFGVLAKFQGENIFIRDQILYPVSFYYFAIVEDFLLRFFWIFAFYLDEQKLMRPYHIHTMEAFLEVFRRYVWNYLRLENEHLFNAGKFRAVRDISISPIDPQDQVALLRMMDEVDGVVNRHSSEDDNKEKDA